VTSSSKQDSTDLKQSEELEECGSLMVVMTENEKSNKALQQKMHKAFIDILEVKRCINKTF
jgi:hypothetical protein